MLLLKSVKNLIFRFLLKFGKTKFMLASLPFIVFHIMPAYAVISIANCLEDSEHIGVSIGKTVEEANRKARLACVAKGGTSSCCVVYATFYKAPAGAQLMCVAGVQSTAGDFDYSIAASKAEALSSALSKCRRSAVSPQSCNQHREIVCETMEKSN